MNIFQSSKSRENLTNFQIVVGHLQRYIRNIDVTNSVSGRVKLKANCIKYDKKIFWYHKKMMCELLIAVIEFYVTKEITVKYRRNNPPRNKRKI